MCIPCRLHHASVYDIFFGSTRCCLMQFMQRHGYALFNGTNQGCLGCNASTLPVLANLSLLQRDMLTPKTVSMPTSSWWAASACRGLLNKHRPCLERAHACFRFKFS